MLPARCTEPSFTRTVSRSRSLTEEMSSFQRAFPCLARMILTTQVFLSSSTRSRPRRPTIQSLVRPLELQNGDTLANNTMQADQCCFRKRGNHHGESESHTDGGNSGGSGDWAQDTYGGGAVSSAPAGSPTTVSSASSHSTSVISTSAPSSTAGTVAKYGQVRSQTSRPRDQSLTAFTSAEGLPGLERKYTSPKRVYRF